MTGYVISRVRALPSGRVVFDIVRNDLQRMHVMMPRGRTDAATVATTIEYAIASIPLVHV